MKRPVTGGEQSSAASHTRKSKTASTRNMFNRFFQSSAATRRAGAGKRDVDGNLTASADNNPSTVIPKFGLFPVYTAKDAKIE